MTAKISNFRTVLHQAVSARVLPAAFALVFGVFMVWGVGFAQPAEIHNAAHDGRHAFSLPCH
ncbi:MAG: CbtB-domain containing protein [Alphaproteobacteria bacterium]|nr:CbtB-domain containing protein [Alphaproteobacteria bacterium]